MLKLVKQLSLTLIYCFIGMWLALPVSYFFQDGIYSQMSLWDYVAGGRESIIIGVSFGAADVYRYTVIGCVIACVFLGKLAEAYFYKQKP